jgi:hypothetical protein
VCGKKRKYEENGKWGTKINPDPILDSLESRVIIYLTIIHLHNTNPGAD